MADSQSEGIAAEIARRHKRSGANPRKVSGWVKDGMPTSSIEAAEEWVKTKARGNHSPKARGEAEESSALDDILREANMASPGVMGLYARARAVEVKAYKDLMAGEGITATQASGYKAVQDAVRAAKDAAAAYLVECRRLIPQEDIMAAMQAQDGVSMGLLASFPYTLAPLLVGQSIEVIQTELINWRDGTYLAKRLESEPFVQKEKTMAEKAMEEGELDEDE